VLTVEKYILYFLLIVFSDLGSFGILAQENNLLNNEKDTINQELKKNGIFTINILNNTNYHAFIYIDGKQAFVAEQNCEVLDYKVNNVKEIFALTFDKGYKWGPIDLRGRTSDFFWKLTFNEKNHKKE